jgi:hypothetical protein
MARALFTVSMLLATAALACPVCGTPTEQNQEAYKFMTIIMSLTPLLAIGSVVFWIFWTVRKNERGEPVVAAPSPPPAPVTDVREQNASA